MSVHIAIVTPVRNGGAWIEATIASLLNQSAIRSGRVTLTYVVQDGASEDDTVLRAERALAHAPGNVTAVIQSASDGGMYDALATGFETIDAGGTDPDFYAYLNAGDLYAPTAFDVLTDFAEQTNADWVCGLQSYFNAVGTLVHTRMPPRFTRSLLRAGAYGRGLPTVQQESTFWSRSLHRTIDRARLRSYRLAGDAYLWWSFAEASEPTIVQAVLGGFTYHGGHLGHSKDDYRAEIEKFAGPVPRSVKVRIAAELALWEQPARVKARFNPKLYLHSTTSGGWRCLDGAVDPSV